MKIITCNARFYGGDDKENHWIHRKDIFVAVLLACSPQVICFQELWHDQFLDIQPAFPDFEPCVMVDRATNKNPLNTILYDRRLFNKISSGGYWLSEKPHVTGSKSWDSYHPRYANWVILEILDSKQEFRIINTHLDHESQIARVNQAQLINEDAYAYPEEYPQILAGDMNSDSSNKVIEIFKNNGWKDTYEAVHGTDNPGYTLHHFLGSTCNSEMGKIDWIFIRGKLKPINSEIIRDSIRGRFPSDHYFVLTELKL